MSDTHEPMNSFATDIMLLALGYYAPSKFVDFKEHRTKAFEHILKYHHEFSVKNRDMPKKSPLSTFDPTAKPSFEFIAKVLIDDVVLILYPDIREKPELLGSILTGAYEAGFHQDPEPFIRRTLVAIKAFPCAMDQMKSEHFKPDSSIPQIRVNGDSHV